MNRIAVSSSSRSISSEDRKWICSAPGKAVSESSSQADREDSPFSGSCAGCADPAAFTLSNMCSSLLERRDELLSLPTGLTIDRWTSCNRGGVVPASEGLTSQWSSNGPHCCWGHCSCRAIHSTCEDRPISRQSSVPLGPSLENTGDQDRLRVLDAYDLVPSSKSRGRMRRYELSVFWPHIGLWAPRIGTDQSDPREADDR